MDELLYRFAQRGDAGIEHQQRYQHGTEVFYPPVSERMLPVGLLGRELRPHDRDHGAGRIGDVVHGIHHDRYGIRRQTDEGLEGGQEDIRYDADDKNAVQNMKEGNLVQVKILASTGVDLDSTFIKLVKPFYQLHFAPEDMYDAMILVYEAEPTEIWAE